MVFRAFLFAALAAIVPVSPARATDAVAISARAPHPVAAVGVVIRDGTAVCTGALISPDLVLTAAHCAEGVGPEDDPARVRFRTGAYPGTDPVERAAARIVRHPLYPRDGEAAGIERRTGYDLALLRLAEPVPDSAAVPLEPVRATAAAPRLLVAGYRGGEGERARERTCPVIEATDSVILMGCDVRAGESGSPILQQGGGRLALVGVLSARGEHGPQKLAIAAGSTRIGQLKAVMGPDLPGP